MIETRAKQKWDNDFRYYLITMNKDDHPGQHPDNDHLFNEDEKKFIDDYMIENTDPNDNY